MTAIFGGAFDPPHNGHVGLLAAARDALGVDEVVVVVDAAPVHKAVETPPAVRLRLAEAAFPGETVLLGRRARTIDLLRDHPEWDGSIFLLGADEFAAFPTWKEPEAILERVRLGVSTRPGFPREPLLPVLERLERPDRVLFFDLEPLPIASRDLRARLDRGEDVHELVPEPVWWLIEREGLYGRGRGYTEIA